jgi:hypothetical protein
MRQYRVWRNMFGVILSKAEVTAFKVQETHSHTRIGQIDFQIVGKGSKEIDARLPVNEKETSCALGIKRSVSNIMIRRSACVANGRGITKQCITHLTFPRDQESTDSTMVRLKM